MFDDQTTSRWIPRNTPGLPVRDDARASRPAKLRLVQQAQVRGLIVGRAEQPTRRHWPPPASAPRTPTQPLIHGIGSADAAPAQESLPRESAGDVARLQLRPELPLWLRVFLPGIALSAATLFGLVITFVQPSAEVSREPKPGAAEVRLPKPVAPTTPPAATGPATAVEVSAAVPVHAPPAPTAAPATGKGPARATVEQPKLSTPAPRAQAQRGLGMLRINSRPWSQVSVDGQVVGHTPIMGLPLQVGEHEVELVNAALDVRKKFRVTIKLDEVVTKVVLLVD